MKSTIIPLVIAALFTVTNVNEGFSKNNLKRYQNKIENKSDNSQTISLYEGENDTHLQPIKQYTIKYNQNGEPSQKIIYKWDDGSRTWMISEKYEYIYNPTGKLESVTHSEWNEKFQVWGENLKFEAYLLDIDKELLTANQ